MRAALVDATAAAGSGITTARRPGRAARADRAASERSDRFRARQVHDARAAASLHAAHGLSHERRLQLEKRVVVEYLGLADAIAQRFLSSGVDPAELRQVAYLGLTKAVQRFDAVSGNGIVAFAVPTISGEIKRHLRDATWAVRPPRALQELSLELRARAPELAQRLGRPPTVSELAAAVGRPVECIAEALECGRGRTALSLDAPSGAADGDDEAVSLGGTLPAIVGDVEERIDLAITLSAALQTIPLAERRAVYLRYFRDMTQVEIAEQTGVSQMQVSRQLRRGLAALRRELLARGVQE